MMSKQDEIDMSVRQFREAHPQSIIAKLKQQLSRQRKVMEALWDVTNGMDNEFRSAGSPDLTHKIIYDIWYKSPTLDDFIKALEESDNGND